jgi:uncharacterized protein with von Willebrand factor type A (vWA) domain
MDSTLELCKFSQKENECVIELKKTLRKKIKNGGDETSLLFFQNNFTENTPIFNLDDTERSYFQF